MAGVGAGACAAIDAFVTIGALYGWLLVVVVALVVTVVVDVDVDVDVDVATVVVAVAVAVDWASMYRRMREHFHSLSVGIACVHSLVQRML